MTIYGTPGGTPLNTTPFQGTAPGNAVQATLPPITPGVGLFVPNSNQQSGASALSEMSKGNLPANVYTTNAGNADSSPGRTVAVAMADGGRNGAANSPGPAGFDTLNGDANGGNSFGAGGMNATEGPSSGQTNQVIGAVPANGVTIAAAPQFGG